eukprot:6556287-Prymnesium_polylepis.2
MPHATLAGHTPALESATAGWTHLARSDGLMSMSRQRWRRLSAGRAVRVSSLWRARRGGGRALVVSGRVRGHRAPGTA